jgi:hypothetical protein
MMTKNCTTHHNACDCREEYFKRLEKRMKEMVDVYKAAKSGKALFCCQGQPMDGYSQLANYNHIIEQWLQENK